MMTVKIKPNEMERFLDRPPKDLRAVLVYGPDAGGVRLYAEKFARKSAGDQDDPFNLRSLSCEQVIADPALLTQEAGNLSLGGGRVIVRVSQTSERCVKAVEHLLGAENVLGLAVLDAGALTPRSALRRLAENAKNIAAIACYADQPRDIARLVQQRLKQARLNIDQEALGLFVQKLGADRAITESEIDKLILYMGEEETQITAQDVMAATGDMALIGFDDLADYAATGNIARMTRVFDQLLSAGLSPIVILNIVSRHFQRLRVVLSEIAAGTNPLQAIQRLAPPVHFTRKDVFMRQCRIWDQKNISRALAILWAANVATRSTGAAAGTLGGQALIQIARRAKLLNRR